LGQFQKRGLQKCGLETETPGRQLAESQKDALQAAFCGLSFAEPRNTFQHLMMMMIHLIIHSID
jgi:hypothetical protein